MVALIQPLGGTETRIESPPPFSGIPTAMSVGLRSGDHVSVWGSVGGSGVRFRLFDPTGNPLGPDQPVRYPDERRQPKRRGRDIAAERRLHGFVG